MRYSTQHIFFVIVVCTIISDFLIIGRALAQPVKSGDSEVRIGDALSIANSVLATTGPNIGHLSAGTKIYHNQTIETKDAAAAEFEFSDNTRLAISENSTIVLDKFILDPSDPSVSEMVVTASIGSFRFISGLIKKDQVVINTPTATIGIRGTAFDLHVTEDGETVLALLNGEVKVCNRQLKCNTTRTVGRLVKVAIGGILTNPD